MRNESSRTAIWIGDKSLLWFDPNWPRKTGPRIFRRGYGDNDSIDLDTFRPVAGYTGSKVRSRQGDESNVQQLLGIYNDNEWVVLNNSATYEQMIPNFYYETHAPDLGSEVYVPVDLRRLGKEGLMIDQEVEYIDRDDITKTMHFKGDKTLRQVIELLINWKWVESAGWPNLLSHFPQLATMTDYLIRRKILFPDGTHPSHSPLALHSIGSEVREHRQIDRFTSNSSTPDTATAGEQQVGPNGQEVTVSSGPGSAEENPVEENGETITLRELQRLCSEASKRTVKIKTVRGWSSQKDFPESKGGNREKTYPRNEVIQWVRLVRGINIH